jgi:hypothetical protein
MLGQCEGTSFSHPENLVAGTTVCYHGSLLPCWLRCMVEQAQSGDVGALLAAILVGQQPQRVAGEL